MHAWAICIEDTRHAYIKAVLPMIVEEQRFGATFAFVIARPWTYRIHVAPAILGLRVDCGVAIDLAGRGLKDRGLQPLSEAQHIDRPVHRCLGRLHRIDLVVDRRRGSSKVVDLIDLNV